MTTAPDTRPTAVLDSAHLGDIQGAFGTIRVDDTTAAPASAGSSARSSRSSAPASS